MRINVENIKVLKVEHNGEIVVFKSDDIVSLKYKSESIKGRIAQIADTVITVDCSTMYNSQIHEVAVKNIEMIVKETAFNKQREDKLTVESAPAIQLEENERIDDLEYKGLKIIQNKKWFCFGIDSVLLSDFAKEIKNNSTVLDLGSGTGIISILLSKKINAKKIVGIEIQKEVYEMSKKSIILNDLENVDFINEDIKNLNKIIENNSCDAIVTNPPYMKKNSGIKNENEIKLISRHEIKCNIEDIIKVSSKLLKDNGELYMVHRPDRLVGIIEILRKYKIEPKKIRFVYSREGENSNLILIKAVKNSGEFLKIEKPLYIYNKNNKYTDEVLEIYNKK